VVASVRAFERRDATACCAIINAAVRTMDGLNAAARTLILSKNVPEALGAELARGFSLVAYGPSGIEAVGMLDGAELKRIYVHPSCQGHGTGKLLVEELATEASRRGHHRVVLQASPSSVPFYAGLGFRKLAEEKTRNGEAIFTHIKMERELASAPERSPARRRS
jgi:GNAT superfamily N-acetyltransferase